MNELYAKFVIARSVLDTFDKGDLSAGVLVSEREGMSTVQIRGSSLPDGDAQNDFVHPFLSLRAPHAFNSIINPQSPTPLFRTLPTSPLGIV